VLDGTNDRNFAIVHPRFTGLGLERSAMASPISYLIVVPALLVLLQSPAAAQDHCLSRAEQRAAITAGKAITLAEVRRLLRQHMAGELVRARLCQESGRLIYQLTVLSRDGRVRRVTVDAGNGTVIGGL
jgi:hypothetical protein